MKFLLHVTAAILGLIGIVLIIAGSVVPPKIDEKVDAGLHEKLQLKQDSTSYKLWKDNTKHDSVPQYVKFYFFNITNVDKVQLGQEKPNLKEFGPYVYRKNIRKFGEKLSDDGNQLTYNTFTNFTFEANQTNGNPETDMITTVNLAYQGVQQQLGGAWYFNLLADYLGGVTQNDLFIQKSVHELLWGYESNLLQTVTALQPDQHIDTVIRLQQSQSSEADSLATRKADIIWTGKDDIKKVLQYVKFQNMTDTTLWNSPEADKVTGTDGSQFAPRLKSGDRLSPWVDDAYRTLDLIGHDNVEVEGVTLLQFKLANNDYQNSQEDPKNAGYFQFGPSGVGNLTSVFKAPVFLSSPHFLDADVSYLNGVSGLKPVKDLHETHIDVEPTTGLTMRVAKRSQISVRVTPSIVRFYNMTTTYIPVMWQELVSTLTPAAAAEFQQSNSQIVNAEAASKAVRWVGWIAGGLMLAGALILIAILVRRNMQKKRGYSVIQ